MTESTRPYNAVNRVVGTDPRVKSLTIQAIAMIEEGELLKNSLAKVGLTRSLFVSCLSSERELSVRLARAMEISADFLVDEAIDAARNEPDVMRARVIAENNRWAASKRNSKRYGDRIDLNVSQSIDISSTLMEARARILRPVSDQLEVVDAQVVDPQGQIEATRTDNESEPDIFS